MLCKPFCAAFALSLLAATVGKAAAAKPTMESVGSGLVCQCGCNGIVSQPCQHYECAYHAEMRAMIQKEIAEGKDEAAIRQDFILRYGVQVLAVPPAKGFNLTVWLLPGIGLLAGLALVVVIVRRWRGPAALAAAPSPRPVDPKLIAAVEKEIRSSGLGIRD